jgi:hypothetical protein
LSEQENFDEYKPQHTQHCRGLVGGLIIAAATAGATSNGNQSGRFQLAVSESTGFTHICPADTETGKARKQDELNVIDLPE